MNKKEVRKLPVGSSHGCGTAESVAKLYGILAAGGQYKGKQVLSPEVIKSLEEPAVTGVDQLLGMRCQFGFGTLLMPVIEDNDLEKVLDTIVFHFPLSICKFCLCCGLTSMTTSFQSCWDRGGEGTRI